MPYRRDHRHRFDHRRKFRPTREIRIDILATNTTTDSATVDAGLASTQISDVTLSLPFDTQPCNLCLHEGQSDCILFNINNALQHARTHHRDANVSFVCSLFKKNSSRNMRHYATYPNAPVVRRPSYPSSGVINATYYFGSKEASHNTTERHTP